MSKYMREFVNEILSYREKFINVKIGYSDLNRIRLAVLKALNLKNINELRDRFEGVAFYENFSNKILGICAIEKLFEIELIDWSNIQPKRFIPKISLPEIDVDVVSCGNGKFPVINKINTKPAIITINMSDDYIWVCGLASAEVLNRFQNDKLVGGVMNSNLKTAFVGFDELIQIKSVDDLKNAISNVKT